MSKNDGGDLTNSYCVPLAMGVHSPSKVLTPLEVMMGKGTAWLVKLEEVTTLEKVLPTSPSVVRSSRFVLRSWYDSNLPYTSIRVGWNPALALSTISLT
jgi:hypothetical protein